jgi:hypothetical protein
MQLNAIQAGWRVRCELSGLVSLLLRLALLPHDFPAQIIIRREETTVGQLFTHISHSQQIS